MNTPRLRFKEFNESFNTLELNKLVTVTDCQHNTAPVSSQPTEYKMIRTGNVRDGKLITSTMDSVNEETYHKWSIRGYLEENDIILTREAPMGEVAIIPKNSNEKFFLGQRCLQLKTNLDLAEPFYIYLLLQSKTFEKYIRPIKSSGSTVSNIRIPELKTFEFKVPSKIEQIKVAGFIKNLIKKIELQREKIDLLKDQKKGYLQQIFSQKIRFKDGNNKFYPEWTTKKIKDVFTVTRGKVLATNAISNITGKYPVYSSQTKNNGLLGYYDDYLFENAITWTTDGANAGDTKYRNGKFYCTNVCGVLINEEGYANTFMAELINSVSHKYVSYVGNPKLMNNVMGEIELKFPAIEEQIKIAEFIDILNNKILLEEQKIEYFYSQKKAFMQQMFI